MTLGEKMKTSHINIWIIVFIVICGLSVLSAKEIETSINTGEKEIENLAQLKEILSINASLDENLKQVINFADSLLFDKKAEESLNFLKVALADSIFADYSSQRELKFKIYDIYSYQWDFSHSIPKVIEIFNADSLHNDLGRMAHSSLWVASTYLDNYDNGNCLKWINKSKYYASQADSTRILAYLAMLEGDIALVNNNTSLAFELYKQAEAYTPSFPVSNTAALIYLSLASIYTSLDQKDATVEYYSKTAEVYNSLEDYAGVSLAYYNLAITYGNMNNYQKALHYSLKSIDVCLQEENKFAISDMLVSCYALTSQLYERLEDWENSLKYLKLSDEIVEDNTAISTRIEKTNQYIRFYTKLDNYDQALHYVKLGDSLKTQQLTPSNENDYLTARLNFYETFGDYEKATSISKQLITNIRKTSSQKISDLIAEHEADKNIDKINQEKQKLLLDNTKKNLTIANQYKTIYLVLSLILLISTLAIIIYQRYKSKTKLASLLNTKVEERTKELKEANSKLLAEIEDHRATTNQLVFAQRLTGVGEIASGLAHEIRNPLTNILASIQILKTKYDIENDEFTNIIIRNTQNANTRVNELLNYSQPIDFHKETISLHRLINEVINLAKGKLNKENIKLNYCNNSKQDLVSVDKKQISTVFLNLILNSIDAIKSTDKEGLIEITSRDEFNFVVVEFTDNGCGIKANIISKIFQPFFSNKKGGTGLGLNLAHKIIHQHGGLISVNSEVEVATTFTVKLLNIKS